MIPGKRRIFSFPIGEGKLCPGINFENITRKFIPVLWINRSHLHPFHLISTSFMIKNNICNGRNPLILQSLNGVQIFLFRSIFGIHTAFLVKFAQIKKIIYIITNRANGTGFISRRQPYNGNPNFFQVFSLPGNFDP